MLLWCIKVTMSTNQCSLCDLNLEIIEKFQANKAVRLVVFRFSVPFAHGNFQKLTPEFQFDQMESAP